MSLAKEFWCKNGPKYRELPQCRVLVHACYRKLLSCLLVGLFFAEPSDEVEEGEQDEAGWAGHGRVPRIELRQKQLVIQRCAL